MLHTARRAVDSYHVAAPLRRGSSRISALASYVPSGILSNAELGAMVETSDDWIVQRTGVHTRHVSAASEFTTDLCIRAVERLKAEANVTLEDVDYVIVCTSTPDYTFPSCAAIVQNHFSIPAAGAFDLSAACAGFAYGLNVAHALVASGMSRKTLLVAGETMTKAVDYTDRATCVLFGDGAGVALIEPSDAASYLIATTAGSDGRRGEFLYRTGLRTEISGMHDDSALLRQRGKDVYRWVMQHVPDAMSALLARAGLRAGDIDWFIPHSANLRIIDGLCERLEIPLERALNSVERCGNTSAASIPLALSAAQDDGRLTRGDRILLVGFGSGLTYAGAILSW